jgi:hypothetical protein
MEKLSIIPHFFSNYSLLTLLKAIESLFLKGKFPFPMLKGAFPKADIVWLFNTHPINFPNQQFNLIKKDGPRQEISYFYSCLSFIFVLSTTSGTPDFFSYFLYMFFSSFVSNSFLLYFLVRTWFEDPCFFSKVTPFHL